MPSMIYFVSPSTKQYCTGDAFSFQIKGQLDEKTVSTLPKEKFDVVFAIGGGSVIDAAKIVAGDGICIAIPTTASGAAMTSHAVVWGKEKRNVKTRVPILWEIYRHYPINLPKKVIEETRADCLAHILDSQASGKATQESSFYCNMAFSCLEDFNKNDVIYSLIDAGNWAGRAIEITGTGKIHQESYALTLTKGMSHGAACLEILRSYR